MPWKERLSACVLGLRSPFVKFIASRFSLTRLPSDVLGQHSIFIQRGPRPEARREWVWVHVFEHDTNVWEWMKTRSACSPDSQRSKAFVILVCVYSCVREFVLFLLVRHGGSVTVHDRMWNYSWIKWFSLDSTAAVSLPRPCFMSHSHL